MHEAPEDGGTQEVHRTARAPTSGASRTFPTLCELSVSSLRHAPSLPPGGRGGIVHSQAHSSHSICSLWS